MRYLYVKFLVKEEIVSFKDSRGINSEFFTRGETASLLFLVHKHRELVTVLYYMIGIVNHIYQIIPVLLALI
ncbi:unnamed protein product [Rhizophagus irregularis]|nr:unnamed protein product [Rhizophagus irregularis]